MEKLNFNIIDIECLQDFFSFQYRTNDMEKAKWVTCENDQQCFHMYKILENAKLPMFCFSINYDKFMLNILCKLVEKGYNNINKHLRILNDLFMNGLDYFQLNKIFWCDNYFQIQKNNENIDKHEVFNMAVLKTSKQVSKADQFLKLYPDLLGKSKVFKNLTICDIPKLMFYYTIDKNGKLRHNLSLKKLQLYYENTNIKFDFSKYKSIKAIRQDNLYEFFREYSLNDVDFLYRFFTNSTLNGIQVKNYPLLQLENRVAACEAVKKFKPEFEYEKNIYNYGQKVHIIYSENNTALINAILKIENPQKDLKIEYGKYIKTKYEKFNELVQFVEDNQFIAKDYELKKRYNEYIETTNNHIETKNIVLDDGTIEQIVENFDIIRINDVDIKMGLGGLHGAIENYKGANLDNVDYTSLYPSVILQYKHIFEKIIDIDLYEQIYICRVKTLKPEAKELKKKINELKTKIYTEDNNKLTEELKILEEKLKKINQLQNGIKLILNSAFGLINSFFNLPVSCKQAGRFITLKCQSILFNLISKMGQTKFLNINTDGLIFENNLNLDIKKLINEDRQGYIQLEHEKLTTLIQKHVNCYIAVDEYNALKLKGDYNPSIKDIIAKNGKFINLPNVLKIIQNKEIEIFPIYINRKYIKSENELFTNISKDVPLYLTSLENGFRLVKTTKQPKIVNNCGEIMYFTTDQNKASMLQYKYHAEILYNAIQKHCVDEVSIKYIIAPIETENNNLRLHKLRLGKLLPKDLLSVLDNKNKRIIKYNKVTDMYTWYTVTNLLSSTIAHTIALDKNDQYCGVLTSTIEDIKKLEKISIIQIDIKNNSKKCFILNTDIKLNLKNSKLLRNTVIPLYSKDERITYKSL